MWLVIPMIIKTSFPHYLLLTNSQVLRLCKAFPNGPSVNIKSSKTLHSEILQSGWFLGRLLGPLLKAVFSLM